ncbi:MAG: lysophospholipid acyltransferase family protein [Verrucomicrobiota bacterium]
MPPLAALLIRLLGMTLRYEDRCEPGVPPGYKIPGPTVFAFWHRSLLACAYCFRGLDIAILISPSFDGELIARTVEFLGFRAIRGSSSRGGAAGLRTMLQAYQAGHHCAFAADGPRGPAFVAKAGVAQLAQSVGTWVGCIYALPQRAWVLRSWDRFLIPKPFSRVVLTWPTHVVAEHVSTDSVQAALDRSVEMAKVWR